MVCTKVIDLNVIDNFVLEKPFYLRSFRDPNICFMFSDYEIQTFRILLHNLGRRHTLY